ncbi:2-oxo acid dehydrogenase subunit E2 [Agromyces arachidis]|uniref:2-oxo acid dehydrogenase subunit E2 n=1 Tax=Agromyces arachidis TaxID=766966 RepID=UPI00405639FC
MPDLLMPSLGADMEHGKVVEWLVRPGDYVRRGELIAAVDTEKTVMEIESFEDGVLAEYLVELGETVPVGTPIARVTGTPADVPAESPPDGAHPPSSPAVTPRPPAEPGERVTPPVRHLAQQLGVDVHRVTGTGRQGAVTRRDVEAAARSGPDAPSGATAGRVRSSPRARRLAADLGIDLADVPGTGDGGAVTEADVRLAAGRGGSRSDLPAPGGESAVPAPPEASRSERGDRGRAAERVAGLRRAIGSLMARSKREVPHYYLSTTIDLTRALDWMREANADRPISDRLVPAALLLAATARAAREVPDVNGFFVDGAFRPSEAVHLGVAVALRGGGLVAPAIRDADSMPLDRLMPALRDLVARARSGRLQRAEMTDPTITVTNLGDLGVEAVFGVIYAPQVALVGFGRVTEQPWARDGMLGVHPVVTATLSADHRVSDGLRGGRFLTRIDELLQEPEGL